MHRRPLVLALLALACATSRPPALAPAAPRPGDAQVRAGFDALLKNDAAGAASGFEAALAQDPADPTARLGRALLAARALDEPGEVAELVALAQAAPASVEAALAGRRLTELAERSPALARAVEDGLARAASRSRGLAAVRLRNARASAATALGDLPRAAALRAEGGAVSAVLLGDPFGALHALEFDHPFAPELGPFPAVAPGLAGAPDAPSRAVTLPGGDLPLEAEPAGGDFFYAASDATLARGGDYLLQVGCTASIRVLVDGRPVAERRAFLSERPYAVAVPLTLAAGPHRLLAKIARGNGAAWYSLALSRADGAASDATFAAAVPGAPAARAQRGPLPPAVGDPAALVAALAPRTGPTAARLLVARDLLEIDREGAKALVAEALAAAPASAPALLLRALTERDDPTLGERSGRARAEADLDAALAADAGGAEARLRRAELARAADRPEDAAALLEALPADAAARPPALVARARVAAARGLDERAEALAEEARRAGGTCAALELLLEGAGRREAASREDELTAALTHCPGGLERALAHRRRRGDLPGAVALADVLVAAGPARVEPRLARARLRATGGDLRGAAAEVAELIRTWPRDGRLEKVRAEYLEAAGDAAGARAARERALRLDGSDLALRRALALEKGEEPLERFDQDGLAAIQAYRQAAPGLDTGSVTVLDLGAVEVHPGGSFTERVHTVIEARDGRAVDRVGEVAVPPGAQLLLARTVKRDGRVLEPEEPLGDKRTLSLPGLEPGDFAEWIWIQSTPARGPSMPGFAADSFFFRADMPLWRSIYTAAAPRDVPMEVDAHHMPTPEIRDEGGERVMRVERKAVAPLLPEPAAPSEAEVMPFVQMGAGADQEALARALGDGLVESFRPSLEVTQLARSIRAGLPRGAGDEAVARAAWRAVHARVLGQGGAFSEPAGAVLARGRGNRTVLLGALLRELGLRPRVALVRDFTRDPAAYRFARAELWAYAVLRVRLGGRTVWLDPTVRGAPFGELPSAVRGADALVLPWPGEADLERDRTPAAVPLRRATAVEIAVEPSGDAVVTGSETYGGYEGAELRQAVAPLDAAARRQAVEAGLARAFRAPALTRFEIEGENAEEGPVTLRWEARVAGWARLGDGRATVETPLFPAALQARYAQRAARELPLLLGSEERSELQVTVKLPPGWKAAASPRTEVKSAYGSYLREERVEGDTLRRRDTYALVRGRVAPEAYPAFAAFAAELDAAQRVPLTFELSTQGSL